MKPPPKGVVTPEIERRIVVVKAAIRALLAEVESEVNSGRYTAAEARQIIVQVLGMEL